MVTVVSSCETFGCMTGYVGLDPANVCVESDPPAIHHRQFGLDRLWRFERGLAVGVSGQGVPGHPRICVCGSISTR